MSNLGLVGSDEHQMVEDRVYAQGFTTGSRSDGYTLHSIQVSFNSGSSSPGNLTVRLRGHDSANNRPASADLATLTKPSDLGSGGTKTFTAPANTTLSANTTYYILLGYTESANRPTLNTVSANGEDSGALSGWSIGNERHSWESGDGWSTSNFSLAIAVRVQTTPGVPTNLTATEGHHAVRLNWDTPTDDGGSPITHYSVAWKAADNTTWPPPIRRVLASDAPPDIVLGGQAWLVRGTYDFRIRAENAIGNGDWSTAVEDVTLGPATVSISSKGDVDEGQNAVFEVSTDKVMMDGFLRPLVVDVTVTESESMLGTPVPTSVRFAEDETSMDLEVPTVDDSRPETDSVVTATIQTGSDWEDYYDIGTSSSATVTVSDDDPPPPAPTVLTALAREAHAVLKWTAPTYGYSVTYEIRAKSADGSHRVPASGWLSTECSQWHARDNNPDDVICNWSTSETLGDETSYVINRLRNGVTYEFEVRANSHGIKGASATASATPMVGTFTEVPQVHEHCALIGVPGADPPVTSDGWHFDCSWLAGSGSYRTSAALAAKGYVLHVGPPLGQPTAAGDIVGMGLRHAHVAHG
ncbi:MAG: fibronectin type III domain-containing protein, partial [Acidobacteria bacterium]|nr:fibronectin type III domain-containing protein [Acidobacteriota bacterium]